MTTFWAAMFCVTRKTAPLAVTIGSTTVFVISPEWTLVLSKEGLVPRPELLIDTLTHSPSNPTAGQFAIYLFVWGVVHSKCDCFISVGCIPFSQVESRRRESTTSSSSAAITKRRTAQILFLAKQIVSSFWLLPCTYGVFRRLSSSNVRQVTSSSRLSCAVVLLCVCDK